MRVRQYNTLIGWRPKTCCSEVMGSFKGLKKGVGQYEKTKHS